MTIRALALSALLLLLAPFISLAQWSDPTVSVDPNEIRLVPTWSEPDAGFQSRLRGGPFWSQFRAEHPRWQVLFDPSTGTVHRAYGPAFAVEDVPQWMESQMLSAGWSEEVAEWTTIPMGKHVLHRSHQEVAGRPVLGTEFVVKTGVSGVISWGAQCHPGATWPVLNDELDGDALLSAATEGLALTDMTVNLKGEWLLPIPVGG